MSARGCRELSAEHALNLHEGELPLDVDDPDGLELFMLTKDIEATLSPTSVKAPADQRSQ